MLRSSTRYPPSLSTARWRFLGGRPRLTADSDTEPPSGKIAIALPPNKRPEGRGGACTCRIPPCPHARGRGASIRPGHRRAPRRQSLCCLHAYSVAGILAPAPVPVGPPGVTALAVAAPSPRPLGRPLRYEDGLVEGSFQGLVGVECGLGRRLFLPDLLGLEAYVVDLFLEDESSGRPLSVGPRQTYIGQAAPWRRDEVAILALSHVSAAVVHGDRQRRSYLPRKGPHGRIGPKIALELLGDDFLENVVPGNPVLVERCGGRHLPGGQSFPVGRK